MFLDEGIVRKPMPTLQTGHVVSTWTTWRLRAEVSVGIWPRFQSKPERSVLDRNWTPSSVDFSTAADQSVLEEYRHKCYRNLWARISIMNYQTDTRTSWDRIATLNLYLYPISRTRRSIIVRVTNPKPLMK
jgi:hypothetical protein